MSHRRASAACLAAALAFAGAGQAQTHDSGVLARTGAETSGQRGHGSMSLTWQSIHTLGLIQENGELAGNTTTDTRSLRLSLDYFVTDRWEAHASLPFIRKRSSAGPGAHRPDLLAQPHPESEFLDDGRFHGDWQDWTVGATYHADWRGFHVMPGAYLVIPSHDYTFFANAAVGQRTRRLGVSIDASRRIGRSNLILAAGYSHEFVEKVMGIGIDKNIGRLSAAYHFSPQLTGRVFATGRRSQGRGTDYFPPSRRAAGDEYWYRHDQLSRHDYLIGGIGASWQFGERYTLGASVAKMYWGRTVHEMRYAYELQLARAF